MRDSWSYEFSERDAYTLFTKANLRPIHRWTDSSSQYSLWLLERPQLTFPLLSSPTITKVDGQLAKRSPFSIPSVGEWQENQLHTAVEDTVECFRARCVRESLALGDRHVPEEYGSVR